MFATESVDKGRPTRTELVEASLEHVRELRREALAARTLARAFVDYSGDIVNVIPSRGDVADRAGLFLSEYAQRQAVTFAAVAARKTAQADELEAELS